MELKAIIIGAIGALVETSEMQRRAFNAAFERAGLDWTWERKAYQQMLSVSGGRNRISAYAEQTNTTLTEDQIASVHATKSDIYQQAMRDLGLALRPGVADLIQSASEAGIKLAFASTTSAENIQAIGAALGDASPYTHFAVMTHSDTVQNRKPAPDVYLHVLEQLNISADRAIAIEDTHESMMSAVNAGIACVATPGDYVRNQDFSEAVAIADPGQIADVEWLRSLIATPTPA